MDEKNNKDKAYELDRVINRYQTYYQILGLENKENITDGKVKKAYDDKCAKLNLLRESKDDFQIRQYSLKALMQDIINIYNSI